MAPAKPATKERGADGAPPGAEAARANGDRHAFNADGRAAEREGAPVTIGEQTLHRRRKNWQVTRELRGLLRRQEKASTRAERARKKIDDLPPDADDAALDELEAQVDGTTDEADEAAYEIIALLLRDDEGKSPALEHLKESLDVEDAGDLAASLAGGGEEPEGPTQTPTES